MSVQIEVTDLHKTYGKNEVLKGISAKFNKGDVVCIIGPSGSGKSTFLRTLNGLEDATSGDVIINGYNLTDKNTDINLVRQHVGMDFQQRQSLRSCTVVINSVKTMPVPWLWSLMLCSLMSQLQHLTLRWLAMFLT